MSRAGHWAPKKKTNAHAHMRIIVHLSPVVQIPPVGGPPRRSADKTPEPPPVVRKKNLQVASSTRGREAQNKPVVQVIRTVKRVRNFRSCIWRSQMPSKMSKRVELEYAPRNDQRRA
jgi:hypothetical protein